jgi:hypothetical protein
MRESRANCEKRREIPVFGTKTVDDPRSKAGADKSVTTGVKFECCATMCGIGSMSAADDAEIVDALGNVGEKIRNREPAIAVAFEFPGGLQKVARRSGKRDTRKFERRRLTVISIEKGFGIKCIDMRGPPFHEKKDDSFGPRRVMGGSHMPVSGFRTEKRLESHLAKAKCSSSKEIAAIENRVHWGGKRVKSVT